MVDPGFVDLHSHVCPSGDDGAQSMAEGVELCERAARHGTRILFATPHVSEIVPPDERREARVAERVEELRERTGVDLRLGWELTPIAELLDEDPRRYALAELGPQARSLFDGSVVGVTARRPASRAASPSA